MDHLPEIEVWVQDHSEQRYDTAGDYWAEPKIKNPLKWHVQLSEMTDWRHEFLVLIHELIEMALTTNDNIAWEDIDTFDTGPGAESDDPGNMPEAPYHEQHVRATYIEQKIAKMLGVDWEEYNKAFELLKWRN